MTARIYVACLASYNNGRLHGRWIDASMDISKMQAEIAAMLRESPYPNVTVPDYEAAARAAGWIEKDGEWLDLGDPADPIHADDAKDACEKDGLQPVMVPSAEEWAIHDYEGLGSDLGEYAGLEAVAKRVEIAEVAEDRDIPISVLIEAMSDSGADDATDFVDENYRGEFETWADYAEEFCNDVYDMKEVPTWLQSHIDWQSVGRDFEISGDMSAYRDGEFGSLYFFWNH